jgi:hypothetical protein
MPLVPDVIKNLAAPALPVPTKQYDEAWHRQFNNILRLFFNRLTDAVNNVSSSGISGVYGYDSAADAFGRFRVSNPQTLFDSKQIYDNQALFWDDQEVSGSGTNSTYSSPNARSRLSVTDVTAGKRVRQTFQAFNYQPGKSQLIYMTGIIGVGETGITQRIGYGDDDNGLFFECVDGVMYVNIRTKTSGSVVNNRVAQADWNVDTLDGNGVSGLTVDWNKTLIFTIDFEWLGVGTVRFGVIVDAIVYYVHRVDNSNALSTVYMSTPNLPLRYELENDGTGGTYELDAICSTVISEGGRNQLGLVRSAGTDGTHVDCANENELYAIVGIRLKSTYPRAVVELISTQMQLQTASHQGIWSLWLNPTVANTFTYNAQTNSAVEIATGGATNTVSNGTKLNSGFIESGGLGPSGAGSTIAAADSSRYLGTAIDGTVDEIVLCFKPVGGSTGVDVEGSITWQEQ